MTTAAVQRHLMQCHDISLLSVAVTNDADGAGRVEAEVQQYVKARTLECEECIFSASGQADAPEEPETTETGTCHALHLACAFSPFIQPFFALWACPTCTDMA